VGQLSIKGLTTATGIWDTSGIGLAIGAGLYPIGLEAKFIIIIGQILLHGKIKWLASPRTEQLILQIIDEPGAVRSIQKVFKDKNITIVNFMTKGDKEFPLLLEIDIFKLRPMSRTS